MKEKISVKHAMRDEKGKGMAAATPIVCTAGQSNSRVEYRGIGKIRTTRSLENETSQLGAQNA